MDLSIDFIARRCVSACFFVSLFVPEAYEALLREVGEVPRSRETVEIARRFLFFFRPPSSDVVLIVFLYVTFSLLNVGK
mgnify:CR=1 FL=1